MLPKSYSDDLKQSPIFVVDDEPVNLKLIERILNADGYFNLTMIQDSHQVTSEYIKKRPHLILLDINMPMLDGFGVLDQLNALNDTLLPPIVFLTAQNAHEYRIKAFESGVMDFISKPFNRVELLSRVKNLLALECAHQALADRNNNLENMVELRTSALKTTQLEVIQRLGRAAEYRDNETGGHILRMSHISALLAKHLNFSESETQTILHASPMHDVGKIAIPDHILLKPGKFEPHEWKVMQEHTTLGAEILSGGDSELLNLASSIALSHHEKWDGSGYPHNLEGEGIPIECRIVAIADVFDALVSERPYKKAWTVDDAQNLINEQSGKHFEPKIVDVFNKTLPQSIEIRNRYQDEDEEQESSNALDIQPVKSESSNDQLNAQ